jgi:hypothetical protein
VVGAIHDARDPAAAASAFVEVLRQVPMMEVSAFT